MADPITDGFSALAELLDEIEEIGIIAQIGVSLGLTLFALVFSRYIILKAAWRVCLLYTSPSPRDGIGSRMPSSA